MTYFYWFFFFLNIKAIGSAKGGLAFHIVLVSSNFELFLVTKCCQYFPFLQRLKCDSASENLTSYSIGLITHCRVKKCWLGIVYSIFCNASEIRTRSQQDKCAALRAWHCICRCEWQTGASKSVKAACVLHVSWITRLHIWKVCRFP